MSSFNTAVYAAREASPPRCSQSDEEPLNAGHYEQLRLAERRARRIRTAAGVAHFNGWMTAIAAVCSAPFALFSLTGFAIAVALTIVAYNEFRGRRQLLAFDPQSTRLLGWNQVAFMMFIIAYCCVSGYSQLAADHPLLSEIGAQTELRAALGSLEGLEQLHRTLILVVYGTLVLLCVVFQGGNAIYYFSRRRHVEEYLATTPSWVLRTITART